MSCSQSQELLSACQGFAGNIYACLFSLVDFHTGKKPLNLHLVYLGRGGGI